MFQQTIVIGRLGKDPEMSYLPDGQPVTHFNVAVNEKFKSDDKNGERVTWFEVTAWGRQAETCNEYLAKGRQVMVRGRISASAWTTQEGQPRASLKISAQEVKFLGNGSNGESEDDIPPEDEPQS
ncbi:MAG: single-stranded DNA-binding protein [Anaerolineae bacterium]|nr:single-stranded DNA-binding protein [Anaerolineae bacterium]